MLCEAQYLISFPFLLKKSCTIYIPIMQYALGLCASQILIAETNGDSREVVYSVQDHIYTIQIQCRG